ncbi:DUF456 domain-containing protein [PVC group bacterium]|nr:DUF456 domain-containing protein [PVC group bacterium]
MLESPGIMALLIWVLFFLGTCMLVFWLPGNLLFVTGLIGLSFATQFSIIPGKILLIVIGLFLLGEAFEWIGAMVGVRVFGASKEAAWGALAGGLIGFYRSIRNWGRGSSRTSSGAFYRRACC